MVGVEVALDPRRTVSGGDIHIAGNDDPIADRRDQRRAVGLAVAVDEQARKTREHGDGVEMGGKASGDVGGADVPGDMATEHRVIEAEVAILVGDAAARVIAVEDIGADAAGVQNLERGALANGF